MERARIFNIGIAVILIGLFWYTSAELSIVLLFIPGVIATYLFYEFRIAGNISKTRKIAPLYLVALTVQLLHFAEEYLMDFHTEMPAFLNQEPYSQDYLVTFNMIAYSVFILGGIVLLKNIRSLILIPLFFIVVGVVLNTVGHIAICIYTGGYFPGIITVIPYLILGPLLIRNLIKDS